MECGCGVLRRARCYLLVRTNQSERSNSLLINVDSPYSEAAEQNNRAFCDKSTILAIHVTKGVIKRFGYWATS